VRCHTALRRAAERLGLKPAMAMRRLTGWPVTGTSRGMASLPDVKRVLAVTSWSRLTLNPAKLRVNRA
jgi:hypothetical protein